MNNKNDYIARMEEELWSLSNKIYKAEKKLEDTARMEEELWSLSKKIYKAEKKLEDTEDAESEAVELLEMQVYYMKAYRNILMNRITLGKGE